MSASAVATNAAACSRVMRKRADARSTPGAGLPSSSVSTSSSAATIRGESRPREQRVIHHEAVADHAMVVVFGKDGKPVRDGVLSVGRRVEIAPAHVDDLRRARRADQRPQVLE